MSLSEVKEVVKVVLTDKNSYNTSLLYAVNYCKYFLTINNVSEARIQAIYIINNIISWRHPQAKEVRRILKEFVKQ